MVYIFCWVSEPTDIIWACQMTEKNLSKESDKSFYCVFCKNGFEKNVETFLRNNGYKIIPSIVERNIVKNRKFIQESRPLISGYVFFEYEDTPNWIEIRKFEHILYPLAYYDNTKQLRNNDKKFVQWLVQNNGIIKISKAIKNGNKIKVMEGPLKDYEKKIVKINKRQKCAKIKIDEEGIINYIWLSYEHI